MAKNELLPFANGEDANILNTSQWEALTDIVQNGFQSGIARSEQVNRVLSQGAVASYVLGQLIVDELNQDATLNPATLYTKLVSALQENAKDACLPLSGGNVTGNLTVQSKNVVRSVNGTTADANGNVAISLVKSVNGSTADANGNVTIEASAKFTVRATFTEECEYKGSVTRTISGLTPGSLICYKIEQAPDNQASATVLRLAWTGVRGTVGTGAGAWVEGTSVTVTLSNPSTTKAVKSILTVYTF